jgi:tRNA A58 N-methylase Trm61
MADFLSILVLSAVLALGLSLLLFQFITGVPPHPSGAAEASDVVALLREATLPADAIIYDLGCGWGSLIIAVARAFPSAHIRGIEISPLPYWIARLRTRKLSQVTVTRGDFYCCDLTDADAATCYLMIKPMPKVASFFDTQLKPGTPVVALTFWFRDRKPAATRGSRGLGRDAALYYWKSGKADR